jgi:prepilin-type N-terminal cleavage/methylation domain-containing protein
VRDGTHRAKPGRVRRTGGFTLIELMIAVAIIGVLAGILVLSFQDPARTVRTTSEARAMFHEFHRAQQQFWVENNRYHSTGATDGDIYPSNLQKTAQAITVPDEWETLRVEPIAQKLVCGYVTIAGTADDPIPAIATEFGMEQPARSWYVVYARCDADGNPRVDARYFSSSVDTSLEIRHEGS